MTITDDTDDDDYVAELRDMYGYQPAHDFSAELRRLYEDHRAGIIEARREAEGEACLTFTHRDFLEHVLNGDNGGGMESQHAFHEMLFGMLGLPRDPWPGLTYDDVERMLKANKLKLSKHRAKLLGLPTSGGAVAPLEKLAAVEHRDWLEGCE